MRLNKINLFFAYEIIFGKNKTPPLKYCIDNEKSPVAYNTTHIMADC